MDRIRIFSRISGIRLTRRRVLELALMVDYQLWSNKVGNYDKGWTGYLAGYPVDMVDRMLELAYMVDQLWSNKVGDYNQGLTGYLAGYPVSG